MTETEPLTRYGWTCDAFDDERMECPFVSVEAALADAKATIEEEAPDRDWEPGQTANRIALRASRIHGAGRLNRRVGLPQKGIDSFIHPLNLIDKRRRDLDTRGLALLKRGLELRRSHLGQGHGRSVSVAVGKGCRDGNTLHGLECSVMGRGIRAVGVA